MKNLFKVIIILALFINNLFALNNIKNSSYINTKNITYNEIDNTIELGKDSLININDINIYTDRGLIDYNTNTIEVFGNLYIYQGEDILSGIDLVGTSDLNKFQVKKVNYIYNNDLNIDSEFMERNNNEVYFYNNFLSPCKINGFFNCPTWSLKIPKTKYIVNKDQFFHFNSFLQIADKKVFYIPYFSHYGAKADRQKGFLNPSFEFNFLNGITGINTPYYLPLNISSDLLLTPKFNFGSKGLEINKNFEIKSLLESKTTGGDTTFELNNKFNNNKYNNYNSAKILTNKTINKNNYLEFQGIFTNSISQTRAYNEENLSSFNSHLKINSFNIINKNDLLISEINSTTSFDESENSLIPYQVPLIKYKNTKNIVNNFQQFNNLDFFILERKNSNSTNPKQNIGLNLENKFIKNYMYQNGYITNNFTINNFYRNIEFANYELDKEYLQTNLQFSTNLDSFIIGGNTKTRLKFIINEDFNTNKSFINQDSNSITFNYLHLFNDNRFYGYDLTDNNKRIVYGLEYEKLIKEKSFNLNIGQSYDFSSNNHYLNMINQIDKFSDVAIETSFKLNNLKLKIDSRLNQNNLNKKEMNYSVNFKKPADILLKYNETSQDAYKQFSDDSKSLKASINHVFDKNFKFKADANLDLKNNFSPYENSLSLSFFDECSEFTLKYTNKEFSDNFNTTPTETISLTLKMDYLGFFGYEQSTNLFFKDTGNFSYGQ